MRAAGRPQLTFSCVFLGSFIGGCFARERTSGWRSPRRLCNGSTRRPLDLLEDVFTRSDLQHLMLIGAYRDNESRPAHPLMRTLEAIKAGAEKSRKFRFVRSLAGILAS